jgi:hypothetical protein
MNKTKRVAAIGLLCVGTSALSFGDVFQSLDPIPWGETYNSNTALFGAEIQQGGANLESGFPGSSVSGTPFTSGDDETFSLTYTSGPDSGLATLTIDDVLGPISITTPLLSLAGGGLDHIGIALNAGSGETITLSNLSLNGSSGETLTSVGPALFDFAMTPPTALSAFTLTGDITMTWSDAAPELSATIVGADATPATPEPGTWALLGSSLVGLGLLRRKRIG